MTTTTAPRSVREVATEALRSYAAGGLQVREVAAPAPLHRAEAEDEAGRTVAGIAVPYGVRTELYSYDGVAVTEEFAAGACEQYHGRTLLYYLHRTPIGKVTEHAHTEAGWDIAGPVSRTATGDEALTLVQDGVIERMSVGFYPREWTEDKDDDGNVHITITRAEVAEVSLVPFPAYEGAEITGTRTQQHPTPPAPTRKETTTMPEDTATLEAVREDVADLSRRFEVFTAEGGHRAAATHPAEQFRSIGHLVKDLAAGSDEARAAYEAMLTRDWEGAGVADAIAKDSWIGSLVEIIRRRQHVLSEFATGTLPETGMGVEYAVLKSDTTQVAEQAAEGDDLLFGKVSLDVETAPVVTLGGWSSLSRQVIERATVGILDTTWEAMAERYGRASETKVRAVLTAAYNTAGAGALSTVEADLETQDGIVAMVLDLVEQFDTAGRSLDGLFVDKASFMALYGVEANDRILQVTGAPADKVGTLTVRTGQGDVAGLQFKLWPGAAANTRLAYDRTAIKTLQAAGVPFRLQDDNVVNLTRDFSLYGYLSSFVQKRAGLVKVTQADD